jgi:hypothetical protein
LPDQILGVFDVESVVVAGLELLDNGGVGEEVLESEDLTRPYLQARLGPSVIYLIDARQIYYAWRRGVWWQS